MVLRGLDNYFGWFGILLKPFLEIFIVKSLIFFDIHAAICLFNIKFGKKTRMFSSDLLHRIMWACNPPLALGDINFDPSFFLNEFLNLRSHKFCFDLIDFDTNKY